MRCFWAANLRCRSFDVSYLQAGVRGLGARTDFANPALFNQLALRVVVGHSGGDASATRLGALRPGSGLENALLLVEHVRLSLGSKCYKQQKATILDRIQTNTLKCQIKSKYSGLKLNTDTYLQET